MLHSSQLLNSRFWADFNWKRQSRVVVFERGAEKKWARLLVLGREISKLPEGRKGRALAGGGGRKAHFSYLSREYIESPRPNPLSRGDHFFWKRIASSALTSIDVSAWVVGTTKPGEIWPTPAAAGQLLLFLNQSRQLSNFLHVQLFKPTEHEPLARTMHIWLARTIWGSSPDIADGNDIRSSDPHCQQGIPAKCRVLWELLNILMVNLTTEIGR